MRSVLGRRASRLAHAAAYDGYDQNGLDVLQPGSRRSRQRSDYQRDRRFGRTNGPHHGPHDHPVPDAQPFEGRRHVESARPVRPRKIYLGLERNSGEPAQPAYLARYGGRVVGGEWRSDRRGDLLGSDVSCQMCGADCRYFPERSDAHRTQDAGRRTLCGTGIVSPD